MGFASLLEEILERLGEEMPHISADRGRLEPTLRSKQLRAMRIESTTKVLLPPRQIERLRNRLTEEGIPSYLVSHYV